MASTGTPPPHDTWPRFICALLVSAIFGHVLSYFIAAALAIQWSAVGAGRGSALDNVALVLVMGRAIKIALNPLIWAFVVVWFGYSTLWLRRKRLTVWAWCAWGVGTLVIGYVALLLVLYPKSDFGRSAILVMHPFSWESAIGIASAIPIGAIVGALLFVLCPKWPARPHTAPIDPVATQ